MVRVMFVVPDRLAAGLIVTIPVEPVIATLRWTESFGTSVGLLEVAITEVMVLVSPPSNGTRSCVSSLELVSARPANGNCVS